MQSEGLHQSTGEQHQEEHAHQSSGVFQKYNYFVLIQSSFPNQDLDKYLGKLRSGLCWLVARNPTQLSPPPGRLRYQNNCHSHAECVSCRGGGWPAVASKRGLTTRSITPTSLQKLLRSASRSAEGGWDSSSDLAHSSRSAYRAACLRRLGCSRHAHATSGEGPALPPSPGGGGGERGAAGRDAESQTVKQKRSVPVHGSTLHRGAHKEMVTALLKTRTLPGGRWPRLRPP